MKILAIETSTKLGSVAIFDGGKLLSTRESIKQRSHSESINVFVDECLVEAGITLADIDIFAAGQGPGSFTGIRIAGNIAKTFAYAYKKPLISIDSLSIIAAQQSDFISLSVVCMINAFKNMVYFARFRRKLFDENENENYLSINNIEILEKPQVVRIQDLDPLITEKVLVVGDGYQAYEPFINQGLRDLIVLPKDQALHYPHAKTLGQLARHRAKNQQTIEWKSFIPLYLRASEAEENRQGILFKPLK